MSTLTEQVRRVAMENGANLIGFAPISRFDNAPSDVHPHTIFPQTKTAIAVAVCQPRGALKAAEEGTYWQAYNCDSYWYLNEVQAPKVLRSIIMLLEGHGYTSVPIHNPFYAHGGRQIREDQPAGPDGMLSLRVLGVAAGLGELGHSKVFLTPQFGPRQRVFGVLTDCDDLEATPLFAGKICDDCGSCVRECEANAIPEDRSIKFTIDGQEYSHALLDCQACGRVHSGRDPRYSPFWTGDEADGEMPDYNKWTYNRFRHLSICVARGCVRACLDHLEKTHRIEATFKTPFIERERWKLNEPPKPRASSSK